MNNVINPTAVIGERVEIGHGNYIGPYCVIYDNVVIGSNNRFEAHASVGSPAEKRGFFLPGDGQGVLIGDSNIIREFATINAGTRRKTRLGNNCIMLRGSHLSHDTIIEDGVNVSCVAMIGGESYIMTGANLGLGAILHQFSVVGAYAMVGMGAVCTKSLQIMPGGVFVGNPAKFIKRNAIGLERNSVTDELLDRETNRWADIRARNRTESWA
jgi:UDP-N-acetylglucosamine acyltransferase